MNAVVSPPRTDLIEVAEMLALFLLVAGIHHFMSGRDSSLRKEAAPLAKRDSVPGTPTSISEEELASLRTFHRSARAIAFGGLHLLLWWAGLTCFSLLRDAGLASMWQIFAFALVAAAALSLNDRFRKRSLSRILQRPNQAPQAAAATPRN